MSIDPRKASALLVSLVHEIPPEEVLAQIGVPREQNAGHTPGYTPGHTPGHSIPVHNSGGPPSAGRSNTAHANGDAAHPNGGSGKPEEGPGAGHGKWSASARTRVLLHHYLHALFETHPELSAPFQNLQVSMNWLGSPWCTARAPLHPWPL